ncbi:MAG TPA: hypothetical protein VD813_15090 [Pseudonocardia sp.]|nr:hypothetical protein [Pseudonocardia sp.]
MSTTAGHEDVTARDAVPSPGGAGPTGGAPDEVPGHLLSCYGAAVAGLLAAVGLPWQTIMGAQLYTAVRLDPDGGDPPVLEFLHQHTPLTGDGTSFSLGLARRGAPDPEAAARGIAAEVDRRGAAVVTGHNRTLPWVSSQGVAANPHWFLVRRGPAPDRMLVSDRFTWTDEAGEHEPYEEILSPASIAAAAWSPRPEGSAASRERWALGRRADRPEWDAGRPWQWLALTGEPQLAGDERTLARTLLGRTAAAVAPTGAGGGWATGPDALAAIHRHVERRLDDPATYDVHNDLWVAGRARELFRHCAATRGPLAWPDGCDWRAVVELLDREIVPRWASLTRVMQYNAVRVSRGGRPRLSVLADLEILARQEDSLRALLASGSSEGCPT